MCFRGEVWEEMHFLAYNYHWSPKLLWGLATCERKKWVQKLIEQKQVENKSVSKEESDL